METVTITNDFYHELLKIADSLGKAAIRPKPAYDGFCKNAAEMIDILKGRAPETIIEVFVDGKIYKVKDWQDMEGSVLLVAYS